jgi:ectoine utilization protein EutC
MADIIVLTETDLRELVGMGAHELETIEAVYPLVSDGSAVMPDIMRIDVEDANGEIDVKSAYLPGHPGIAIKVSAGFFDNPAKGLPSLGGFMMVLDAATGVTAAALFDNGYLTDLRTALAGAVAARHLAAAGSRTVAILGAGVQARLQLEALSLVMEVERATVWARRADAAEIFAAEVGPGLGLPVDVASSVDAAVAEADVVVTTTPATAPLLQASHLRPGLHVTAVGSDAPHKRELGSGVLEGADVVAVDSLPQSLRLGEARGAVEDGLDRRVVVELGDVIAGRVAGRTSDRDVTVCDLTGTGAQDTAIAGLAVERARQAGVGDVVAT